jgi:hypothetical protein
MQLMDKWEIDKIGLTDEAEKARDTHEITGKNG